jgi:hypothetical protein
MNSICSFLLARLEEPSTRAGAAAALGVIATAIGASGGSRFALGGILLAALMAAVSAMMKADPRVMVAVKTAADVEADLAPLAEAAAPEAAPVIRAVTTELRTLTTP